MIAFQSYQERLAEELRSIEAGILDLWRKSQIEEFRNDPDSSIVLITHRYYWKPLAPEHRRAQARIIGQYAHWWQQFKRFHAQYGSEVQQELKETNEYVTSAIELQTGWSTESTVEQNGAYLAKMLAGLRQLLSHSASGTPDFVLVPDTNALLKSADPAHYTDVIGSKVFRLVIVPTVLSELDGLKRNRANQTLGEKAERAIRVIKGLRKHGSVLDGVIVARTITVQMIPTEPRISELPSWLDPSNQDDRIIGSILEIQYSRPSAVVVVVTDDINLQNKAEMAFLSWAEPPDPATKLVSAE